MRRVLAWVVISVVVAVMLIYAAGGWYFAGRIESSALAVQHPEDKTVEVLDVTSDEIAVRETGDDLPALAEDMVYGLTWEGGHGQVHGPPHSTSGSEDRTTVIRSFRVTDGAPPSVGDTVAVDRDVYPPEEDPSDVLDTTVEDIEYSSPAGQFGAWHVPGSRERRTDWVIYIHGGLGSDRSEALRAMRTTKRLGLPSLTISYRNDRDVPGDDSERYQYGRTEWRDLEGAVRYALDHGAVSVTLVGYSMGGAIAAAFLQQSPLAPKVTRVVLDSPNLDLRGTVEYGAEQVQLPVIGAPPASMVWVAERVAAARYDLDWDAVDYLDDTSWLRVPTLVFQGTDDLRTPPRAAELLHDHEPDLVTLVKVDGAGHVESWNADPRGYGRQLAAFLTAF